MAAFGGAVCGLLKLLSAHSNPITRASPAQVISGRCRRNRAAVSGLTASGVDRPARRQYGPRAGRPAPVGVRAGCWGVAKW